MVVGVGAKPNTELFKGQLDLLEDKPGGVKVLLLHYPAPFVSADLSVQPSLVKNRSPTSMRQQAMQCWSSGHCDQEASPHSLSFSKLTAHTIRASYGCALALTSANLPSCYVALHCCT